MHPTSIREQTESVPFYTRAEHQSPETGPPRL
jgi:hypothetical protein